MVEIFLMSRFVILKKDQIKFRNYISIISTQIIKAILIETDYQNRFEPKAETWMALTQLKKFLSEIYIVAVTHTKRAKY